MPEMIGLPYVGNDLIPICRKWLDSHLQKVIRVDLTAYMQEITRSYRKWLKCVYWLIYVLHIGSHLYVWRDSFICETWLIHMCDITHSYVWHESFLCVTLLIHVCVLTHLCTAHRESFICVTWLIHMWNVTHSYVWHVSFICVTWVILMCDIPHSYVCIDSFMYCT